MIQGEGFRVQGSGFRVQGSGFRGLDSGFRAQGSECGNHQVEKLAEAGIVELHDGRVHVRVHVAPQPSVSVREHLVPLRLIKPAIQVRVHVAPQPCVSVREHLVPLRLITPAIQTNGLADAQVPGRGVQGYLARKKHPPPRALPYAYA